MMHIAFCSLISLFTSIVGIVHGWRSGGAIVLHHGRPSRASGPSVSVQARYSMGRRGSNVVEVESMKQQQHTISKEQRRQQSLDAGRHPLLSLNLNLDALARARAPERAQELYQRIQALHQEGYYAVAPDVCSFNSVLKAWQDDPEKALEFWESAAVPGRMNVRSYNTFLLSLAKAGLYDSAESLLEQMQGINAAVRPDRISWNTVLLAYATAGREEEPQHHLAERAELLLRKMINGVDMNAAVPTDNSEHDLLTLPPTIDPNYIPPKPDATSFNTLIYTWASHPNANEAAAKSEYWLRFLQQKDSEIAPDAYTYSTVIKALSRSRAKDIGPRVLALLKEMESGDGTVRPNCVTYTVAIEALCQNRQLEDAMRLFDTMSTASDLRPDAATFTTLMDGWARFAGGADANKTQAVAVVQRLLGQMKHLSQKWPDCTPNERTYTSILKTYAASRQPYAGSLARQLLSEMPNSKVLPGTIHYNAALACYAKSPRATKAVEAEILWKEMTQAGVACDTITYNTILNAAANSFGSAELKERSFQIGQAAFDRLHKEEFCAPTSLSYSYYFKMVRRLSQTTDPNRFHLLKSAFDLCCERGCVNEILLQQIVNTTRSSEAKHIFEGNYENRNKLSSLPLDWSCNAMGDLRQYRG
jgi:pentatricopeptide repeat protein